MRVYSNIHYSSVYYYTFLQEGVMEDVLTIEGEIDSIEEILPQEHNVYRINSIKKLYPEIRQKSKAPTFA